LNKRKTAKDFYQDFYINNARLPIKITEKFIFCSISQLQDPQPERNFFRRGWVTFDRTVNIKDICWNLNNIRLRDCEMGPTVNRELKQRVRAVNGITAHKQVVKSDIKNAAKIITNLDTMWKLWEDEEKQDTSKMVRNDFKLVRKYYPFLPILAIFQVLTTHPPPEFQTDLESKPFDQLLAFFTARCPSPSSGEISV
jgi:hypothetical protein